MIAAAWVPPTLSPFGLAMSVLLSAVRGAQSIRPIVLPKVAPLAIASSSGSTQSAVMGAVLNSADGQSRLVLMNLGDAAVTVDPSAVSAVAEQGRAVTLVGGSDAAPAGVQRSAQRWQRGALALPAATLWVS